MGARGYAALAEGLLSDLKIAFYQSAPTTGTVKSNSGLSAALGRDWMAQAHLRNLGN